MPQQSIYGWVSRFLVSVKLRIECCLIYQCPLEAVNPGLDIPSRNQNGYTLPVGTPLYLVIAQATRELTLTLLECIAIGVYHHYKTYLKAVGCAAMSFHLNRIAITHKLFGRTDSWSSVFHPDTMGRYP